MPSPPSISVLIRTYNSEKTLARLLSKLVLAPGDEVLVVDSGSQDLTSDVAARFGARLIQAPLPFSYSKSLNAGFKVAKNPLVHVLSSHAIPMVPDLLDRMRKLALEHTAEVAAFYGPSGISGRDDLGTSSDKAIMFQQDEYSKYSSAVGNANTLYRHAAWLEIPFDEGIRTDEDKTWARCALQAGYLLAYAPSAPVLNKSNYSLAYMFRKGQSDARAVKIADAPPMSIRHLCGGLKKMLFRKLSGEIDFGNWIRYSAHIFGQYSGSRLVKDNTPRENSRTRP
ncbi:MAG: glycosyltransferase family 2 protein [Luteolibacter sp.]